jgi:uncharacterized protein (UPF0276 family)
LAATYEGGDIALLERIVSLVDFLEITPDSIARRAGGSARLDPVTLEEIRSVGRGRKALVHGVGLSIGTASGWNDDYLRLLDELLPRVDALWHSEHLGITMIEGEHLGSMLALPRTERMLDLICERVRHMQEVYGLPFLVENIVHLLPDAPSDYTDAGFLNALAGRTGCSLILDVYNLECDAHNYGFDIDAFLAELDMRHVREIHVAGGVAHRGYQLDVHSRVVADSTVALARRVIDLAPNNSAITYELLPEAVPVLGHKVIAGELTRLRNLLAA